MAATWTLVDTAHPFPLVATRPQRRTTAQIVRIPLLGDVHTVEVNSSSLLSPTTSPLVPDENPDQGRFALTGPVDTMDTA